MVVMYAKLQLAQLATPVSEYHFPMLNDTQRERLYKLTQGVPLAVQLAVRQLGRFSVRV